MFTKFNQQIKTIFLDPSSASFDLKESLNVVLSPSLYWVKKVSLPVKYMRDVKPLLPSLFEDTLPEGNYSYTAYKSGDEFFIFAYEDRVVLDTLSQKGVSPTKVKSIYFAQSELNDTEGAIKINETQSIFVKDEIVILLPCCWVQESGDLDIDAITLSKHHVKLKQFGHIVDDKSLYSLVAIFVVLVMLVGMEYVLIKQKVETTLELRDELFVKNGLKPTMMQNRSMLKEKKSLRSTQIKLRESISFFLSLRLKKEQKLSLLNFKGKKLTAEFSGVKKGSEVAIEKVLKSKKLKFKSSFKENSWHVEVKL